MTNKHFKAVHKQTAQTIEFGLEDIWFHFETGVSGEFNRVCVSINDNEYAYCEDKAMNKRFVEHGAISLKDWLKDYDLFYQHQGEYHKYEV